VRYYPINLHIEGKKVVIVGGGTVAERKARRLVAAGAEVTVIAPEVNAPLADLAAEGNIIVLQRRYAAGDLDDALLVFAATGDPEVNRAVANEAESKGVLVDAVDAPAISSFTTPAVLERGEFLITVSTGGASPALSRRVVRDLATQFGPEYAEAVALLKALREKILTVNAGNAYNGRVFSDLAALDLPALIKNGQRDAIDQILLKLSPPGSGTGPDGAGKKDPS
jgi:precorrin-2 dehydrogenase / sirohydrochlorin ferrochelatase